MAHTQPADQAPTPLERWLRTFLLDVQIAGRSPATLGFYTQKLQPFLAYLAAQGVTAPEQISAAHVRAFLACLAASHTPGGVHAYWRGLRAFMRFLAREEAIADNPLRKLRAPRVEERLLEPVGEAVVQAAPGTPTPLIVPTQAAALVSVDALAGGDLIAAERLLRILLLQGGVHAGLLDLAADLQAGTVDGLEGLGALFGSGALLKVSRDALAGDFPGPLAVHVAIARHQQAVFAAMGRPGSSRAAA